MCEKKQVKYFHLVKLPQSNDVKKNPCQQEEKEGCNKLPASSKCSNPASHLLTEY
jgi:hypothetical protein